MDYQELLFAVEVRRRTAELWSARATKFEDSIPDGPAKKQQVADWEKENPKSKFLKDAYNELVWVAQQVREFRAEAGLKPDIEVAV